ncbi:hypothetical protein BU25DRAFT_409861 [Macroventuria anomochaeta]|uniref:Uncharacterized protein n=1 Tax=Macroventuria anomochaeta TaxID=301207 RepID=A0ACB6S3J7_9PLEO|nr:uncharacterized protein BU25DRAFT_409861 [Macroventuria anomochaeta]KAF2628836.1 hypothetical protein BU25DRAFT_409861 [Macroventuria anomochaeta]
MPSCSSADRKLGPQKYVKSVPTEILNQVSTFLPVSPILPLRLTSRTLAYQLPLNQRFFRKLLLSGNLLPFLWDLDRKAYLTMQHHKPT